MESRALQVAALNLGGFATGMMYGSGAYRTRRVLFALNVMLNVSNFVALMSHVRSCTAPTHVGVM